ncbi:MAG TPA: NAD(P)/FAD-dependent oxidoreductase [Vicinamibacterales bacterium]|nr:NAD(P)/FAD-dependent oxidoreductase [Vicinamibacterales bacterium]
MATCDVLIVGGGPAGATCAWRLRQAGLDVMVADAARFPRDKVCAGWITPQAVTALRLDTQAYASGRTLQPFTGFRVGVIGAGDATEVSYDHPVSFGIRRCEFDHYLLERAGARLMLGAPILSVRRDRGEWIVNDAIRAPLLVGAGGSGCPVARMLNGAPRGRPLVVAREAEARVSAAELETIAIEPEVPELFFCRDLQGYGWCVRKGDYLNVGLGRLDPRSLPAATERFAAFLETRRRIPAHFPWRWRGHWYAVQAAPRGRMIDDGVLLIGDAAGVADPQSGEGIRQAVESGLLAAETIVAARGEFSRQRLEPYAAGVAARLADARLSGAVARLVPDAVKAVVAGRLLRIPAFVKRVVIDEWFLHRHQVALAR